MLKTMLTAALAAGTMLVASAPADAAQGCGRGYHRAPRGHCVPNFRARGPVLVVGNFYQGRGFWDGRRYYQNRYRHHGGWRYR